MPHGSYAPPAQVAVDEFQFEPGGAGSRDDHVVVQRLSVWKATSLSPWLVEILGVTPRHDGGLADRERAPPHLVHGRGAVRPTLFLTMRLAVDPGPAPPTLLHRQPDPPHRVPGPGWRFDLSRPTVRFHSDDGRAPRLRHGVRSIGSGDADAQMRQLPLPPGVGLSSIGGRTSTWTGSWNAGAYPRAATGVFVSGHLAGALPARAASAVPGWRQASGRSARTANQGRAGTSPHFSLAGLVTELPETQAHHHRPGLQRTFHQPAAEDLLEPRAERGWLARWLAVFHGRWR